MYLPVLKTPFTSLSTNGEVRGHFALIFVPLIHDRYSKVFIEYITVSERQVRCEELREPQLLMPRLQKTMLLKNRRNFEKVPIKFKKTMVESIGQRVRDNGV